jgi:hypothetical protein
VAPASSRARRPARARDPRARPSDRAGSPLRALAKHRENFSVNDAAYVAQAELFEIVLVSADVRLASAPGLDCQIDVLR